MIKTVFVIKTHKVHKRRTMIKATIKKKCYYAILFWRIQWQVYVLTLLCRH